MSPSDHAISSASLYGGNMQDYLAIHAFLDSTKLHFFGPNHRVILHNTFGIELCERIFGYVIINSDNQPISVRSIAAQHIKEDLGFIPTLTDLLNQLKVPGWIDNISRPDLNRIRNIKTIEYGNGSNNNRSSNTPDSPNRDKHQEVLHRFGEGDPAIKTNSSTHDTTEGSGSESQV